jgi:Na+/proline symporter
MKKTFGIILIIVSTIWGFLFLALASDSFINGVALLLNLVGCCFGLFFGIRMIVKKNEA